MYTDINVAYNRIKQEKIKYELNLNNKDFAFMYIDKSNNMHIHQVSFRAENFLHLTGLDYKNIQSQNRINNTDFPRQSKQFYERLGNDDNVKNDISFRIGRDEGETARLQKYTSSKLENLSRLMWICAKAEKLGNYHGNRDFDFVIGRGTFSLALQHPNNDKSKICMPMSSLSGNINNMATDIADVIAVFEKNKTDKTYTISYLNKNVSIGKRLFSPDILDKFNIGSFAQGKTLFNRSQLSLLLKSYTSAVTKYILNKLDIIAQARNDLVSKDASTNDIDKYLFERDNFFQSISKKEEAETAVNILSDLKSQYKDIPENEEILSYINEELDFVSSKLNELTVSKPSIEIKPIEFTIDTGSVNQNDGTMALSQPKVISIPNPLKPLGSLLEKAKSAITNFADSFKTSPKPKQTQNRPKSTTKKTKGNSMGNASKPRMNDSERSEKPITNEVTEQSKKESVLLKISANKVAVKERENDAPKKERQAPKKDDITL